VPIGFGIEFEVQRGIDGLRRFVPLCGYHGYLEPAFVAGLAVLTWHQRLQRAEQFAYRAAKLIFDRVRTMQEHQGRKFSSARDLYVRPRGRGAGIETSVLPPDLGLDSRGAGRPWSNSELTARGRELAQEDGIEAPTTAEAIRYGLFAAAIRNPLMLPEDQVASLIRLSLFGQESAHCPIEVVDEVERRLIRGICRHLPDNQAEFHRWYDGPKSNLVKWIAGQSGGQKLDGNDVRGAVIELGWRAHRYISNCLNMFAQAFRASLPEPMSAPERQIHEQMYQPRDYLGNLPLVLLMDRMSLLRPVLSRLWTAPDDRWLIGVLHRMLNYFRHMASVRRQADRLSKRRKDANGPALEVSNWGEALLTKAPGDEQVLARELIAAVIERRNIKCPACTSPLDQTGEISPNGDDVVIQVACPLHGAVEPVVVPIDEMRSLCHGWES
jgi:hypothetical protein